MFFLSLVKISKSRPKLKNRLCFKKRRPEDAELKKQNKAAAHEGWRGNLIWLVDHCRLPRTGSGTWSSPFRLQEAEGVVMMKMIAMVEMVST